MSLKTVMQKLATEVIGMTHDQAVKHVAKAGKSYQFIVMEGKPCGRNHNHSNSTVCLYTDFDDIVYHAQAGTKGAYDNIPGVDNGQ